MGTEITVTRQRMRGRFGGHWHYYATGPDMATLAPGDDRVLPRRFDNDSLPDLRRVLRRAYGRDTRITTAW